MFKQTLQIFDRLIRRASRRRIRATHAPARARTGLLRAEFECLESRSLLSLAPTDDAIGSKLDIGWLQKPDYGDISILPIWPIEDGARPLPPNYPSWPPPLFEPYVPPPPLSDSPDNSDVGGFTEIDNTDKGGPGILVGPASDKIARDVLKMLDSLLFVPSAQDSNAPPTPERTKLRAQDEVSPTVVGAGRLDDVPEGGMIALMHDAAILQSVAKDGASHNDIDSWLSIPVRMDSAPGKFQAFDVSSAEPPPAPAPSPPVNEVFFLAPPNSPSELAPAAAAESLSQNSVSPESAAAIDQLLTESTVDLPSSPALPAEQNNKNSSSKPVAAAAVFIFLAVRAARGARATETSEPQRQTTWTLRHPARPES
jgi:hypothetical protein